MENLSNEFYNLVNNLFKNDNIKCKSVILDNNIWFSAKDIFNLLDYSQEEKKISQYLSKINNSSKLSIKDILIIITEDNPEYEYLNSLNENQQRKIYINRIGLYKLILLSRKPSAEKFKDFITEKLFPALDDYYRENLKKKDNTINSLEKKIDEIISTNNQLLESNKRLENTNNQLLDLAKKQDIKLDSVQEELSETSNNLDQLTLVVTKEILPNRNLSPEKKSLCHSLILFKDYNDDYVFIRGQNDYIDKMIKDIDKEDIIINNSYPNPIDLLVKLKEKSNLLNHNLKEKVIKYLNKNQFKNISKEQKVKLNNDLLEQHKRFTIVGNKLNLNHTTLDKFMNIYNEIIQEQLKI